MTLEELYKIIEDRKKNMSENSYVASLFRAGRDGIIQKVGEEATEVIIAAKNEEKEKIISEVADLWFHTLILLSLLGIQPGDIFKELDRRNRINPKRKYSEFQHKPCHCEANAEAISTITRGWRVGSLSSFPQT